jgi:hypothetical protein
VRRKSPKLKVGKLSNPGKLSTMGGVVVWRKSQLNNVKKDKTTPAVAMMIKNTLANNNKCER